MKLNVIDESVVPDWSAVRDRAAAEVEALREHVQPPSRRDDAFRRIRSYRTTAESYLENRRRARAGREDLLPLYFVWTVSRQCNFLCSYCDDHRGQRYPELPREGELDTEAALEVLRVMRTRTPSVYFAGGEPTLRDDLPELLREARALRYYPTILNTNGSAIVKRLRQPRWSRVLGDLDIVVVSLDSLDLGELRSMWGYRKPQEVLHAVHVLAGLAQEMRFRLMVNCVIQPGRVEHARAVLDLARDLDITFAPVPMNVGPTVSSSLFGDEDYRSLVQTILARKRAGQKVAGSRRLVERLLTGATLECRNTLKPHVDHDGGLFWPCKASVDVEPLKLDVREFDDVDALYARGCEEIDPTDFASRCGAKCNWAQNYSTDAYAHGLVHPLSLLGEVREFLS